MVTVYEIDQKKYNNNEGTIFIAGGYWVHEKKCPNSLISKSWKKKKLPKIKLIFVPACGTGIY